MSATAREECIINYLFVNCRVKFQISPPPLILISMDLICSNFQLAAAARAVTLNIRLNVTTKRLSGRILLNCITNQTADYKLHRNRYFCFPCFIAILVPYITTLPCRLLPILFPPFLIVTIRVIYNRC